MAISVTDAAAWATSSGIGVTAVDSNSFNVTAGDLIIIVAIGDDGNTGAAEQPFSDTLTDNQTPDLTWSVITSSGARGSGYMKAWWAVATSSISGLVVTATRAGAAHANPVFGVKPYIVTGHNAANPIGATWNTSNTSTTNNWTPNTYTSTANNSRGLAVAVDWSALGAPTSTDTASAGHNGNSVSWLSAHKVADTTNLGTAVAFNFDAAGSSNAAWRAIAFEIVPASGTTTTVAPAQATTTAMGRSPVINPFSRVIVREQLINESGSPVGSRTGVHLIVWYGERPVGAPDLSYSDMTTDPNGTVSWSIATGSLIYNQAIYFIACNGGTSISEQTCGRIVPSYEL